MSDQFKPQTAADLYRQVPCACGETGLGMLSGAVVYTLTGAHRRDGCSARPVSYIEPVYTNKFLNTLYGEPVAELQPHESRCDNGACWCWAAGA
jgi:hypothetical protein